MYVGVTHIFLMCISLIYILRFDCLLITTLQIINSPELLLCFLPLRLYKPRISLVAILLSILRTLSPILEPHRELKKVICDIKINNSYQSLDNSQLCSQLCYMVFIK